MGKIDLEKSSGIKKKLVGSWKLVDYHRIMATGDKIYPWGKAVDGRLTYTSDGQLSVQQMKLDRTAFASGDGWNGTSAEIEEAFKGYLAYCGRYELHEEGGAVHHIIECCLLPHWVGLTLLRYYQFTDNRLTLTSAPTHDASIFSLTWERF
jgi:hypothetical protein